MRIIQPIMHSVLHGWHIDETCLDEKSFALLKEIQKALSEFEPINDDELGSFTFLYRLPTKVRRAMCEVPTS